MSFKLGDLNISDVKLGESQVNKIMLGSSLVWQKVVESSYHQKTQNVIDYANSMGFAIPDSSKLSALNTFIVGLIDTGVWERYNIHYIGAYNNSSLKDFSRINIINPPANLMTIESGVDFTQRGWKFKGLSTSKINLNFLANSGSPIEVNNAHQSAVIYDDSEVTTLDSSIISGWSGNKNVDIWHCFNSETQKINTTSDLNASVPMHGVGFKAISKSTTNNILANKDQFYVRDFNTGSLRGSPGHLLGAGQSSTQRSVLGISTFSMGSAIDDKFATIRTLYNNYLTSIGLTTIA